MSWGKVSERLGSSAGVYAFLLPKRVFPARRTITLHGPSAKKIRFEVRAQALRSPIKGFFIAYAGRSSNLAHRLPLHFQLSQKTTAAQVRKTLEESLHLSAHAAREFMLQHALLAYRRLPGDANVANRDIIEVALWAKYTTPFNIKSER